MEKHCSTVCALITLSVIVHINIVLPVEAECILIGSLERPGHCPPVPCDVSSEGCVCDADCKEDHKCCVFSGKAVCVPPDFSKPGECPDRSSNIGLCAELCSNDSKCPGEEKCCFNGCGHDCLSPHSKKVPGLNPICAEVACSPRA
ncbi:WAP four-disulfide core domain protein 3 [Brachionichthys hirsutus]|uniref:WAP four-disulfide core domain protein 3 n=1 Tax=Brachionichthys hirsutus TaxID=412623 RepID=UPI00360434F1